MRDEVLPLDRSNSVLRYADMKGVALSQSPLGPEGTFTGRKLA